MREGEDAYPQVISAHFGDPDDARKVRAAAEALKVSPSTFLRDAALQAAAVVTKACPHCGAPRKGVRRITRTRKANRKAA